ncbi:serine-rich adhesin for platelets-like isoform X2 [Palaemon carinicauda]|uniref:serine-rich adhesin for platelets-like isoform X2 n=1 Tax=Palaemon carinicauda TaxID=392227 RepID=UPI0035B5E289
MAASEDEGSQSDNKNDDSALQETSKQFSTIHQEIESQLERPGVSYEARVSAVLSGWERLAGFVHGDVSQMQPLATYLYRWSLRLVLQGQWPGLAQIVKTRLGVTLQRCSKVSVLEPLCRTLLPLVSDPWGHQTKTILSEEEITDEEAINYVTSETWEVIRVRVDTMVESRCEKLALLVLRVCFRCIHLQSEGMVVPLYTEEDHNHFVDLHFVLLYKFERNEFVEEVKKLDINEGVELVRRLVGKQDKLKVWKHRLKIADLAIQIFLATSIVKKYSPDFDHVFHEWCNVQEALSVEDTAITATIRKYIQLSESSKHLYAMSRVLHEKSGSYLASLVTELLIRALTTDMNSLEALKLRADKDSSKAEQLYLEHQMATGFMDLGAVFTQHKNVARECILTAFSLHPTSDRLGLLSSYVNAQSPPHTHAGDSSVCKNPSVEELQGERMMMGSPVTSLSPLPSTDMYAHSEVLNGMSSSSLPSASPYPYTPAPCNDSSDQENSRTQASVEQVKSQRDTCQEGNNGDNSLNDSDMFSAQEGEENQGLEPPSAEGLQVNDYSDQYNVSRYSPCTSQPKDPPPEEQCTVDIPIDTGQDNSSVIHRQDSQFPILSSDAQVTGSVKLHYTKESEADKSEISGAGSVSEDKVATETKSKEDIDSMDTFYKSTENFIKQLREEPPKKSPTQTSGEVCENYDILTQPNQVLDSQELGLSKELCDDLAVVLSSPRWQVLSWMLDRHELLGICDRYLHDADSAKNLTKELKYLNIDYSLFKHMPSAEINEFTGIEKGYEHFIEYESESEYSAGEYQVADIKGNVDPDMTEIARKKKRKEDIKKAKQRNKMYDSDSDSHGRLKDSPRYMASYSDSEESDADPKNKTLLIKMDHDGSRIEGKRVTAVSSQDRSKRIRIDAGTGKIKRDRIDSDRGKVRQERNLMNTLRLFRHKKYKEPKVDTKLGVIPKSSSCYAPRLSSLNVHPKVVLTERDRSTTNDQIQSGVTTVMAGSKRPAPTCSIPSSQSRGSWIYAGSLVAPPNSANSTRAVTPISVPRSSAASVQCYLRSKDGKVRMAPLSRALLNNARPANPVGGNTEKKALDTPTSGYMDSYTKFLLQSKKSSVTLVRKNMTLDASLDYLEKQGTTVTFKSHKGSNTHALANAQKNVLNRIMSPENALSAMRDRFNERMPVRAIAMPVSNNVPNMPTDKSSPANLSRVLPKGTTVVRKPKADGAGPSGLNNGGGPSGGAVSPRAVITRPGGFSAVVARPSITVSNASLRTGNSIMSVRNSSATIRTPVSRGIVVAGSSGTLEATASNSTTSLPVSSSIVTSAAAIGSVTMSMPAPLVSATVVGSVLNSNSLSSPMGTLGGSNGQQPWENALDDSVSDSSPTECSVALTQNMSTTRGATTCTTTVASPPGDVRAASMLETLLRDRPIPASPLQSPTTTATTTITAALPQTLTSIVGGTSIPITVSGEGQVTSAVMGALANTGNSGNSVVIAGGSSNNSGVIVASGMVGGAAGSGVVVASGGVVSNTGVVTAGNSALGGGDGSAAVQQVLVPGQLVQVHTSDGSTGLGIVHSSSLDLRLPAGTRVIKSSSGPVRTTASQQHQVMGVINQAGGRQVNVLHNVKILQNVQNRQIVRTVVVPHSVAVQGLGSHQASHLKPQLVALSSQGTSTATSPTGVATEATIVQTQGAGGTVRAKIPSSTIVQKVLGRGGLVIRTLRPQAPANQVVGETSAFEEGLGAKLQQQQQQTVDEDKSTGTATTTVVARLPQDEGLGERLSHYLKTALVSSTSTQSVGTQTLTTAVKPSAGQCVTQVAMNHLRGGSSAIVSLGGGGVQGISVQSSSTASTSPAPSSQQAGLTSLPLTPTNVVSSETLEQLREFESVFEKVSNKSGKDTNEGEASAESYSGATVSSEESMIAAQLLSMANDTPVVTTSSNYVYSVPASVYEAGSTRLTEGTYITIPSTTQAGSTLILVNHSGGGTGLVTVAGGVQGQHPPSAPSPTLSSTSSHSSIASSPSSTSSKNKKQPPKPKVVPPTTPPAVPKPKTPPPPKTPAPKPTVAKPQVEESDELKARIQVILERYKQDLAITPQPQPAPRNRKNCPPPKSDGKSSNKKKSGVKKVEGSAGNSPAVSEGSIAGCPSPSPSPGPASDSSVGLSGNSTGVGSIQYTGQGLSSQGTGTTTGTIISEEKVKTENNIKVETGQDVVAATGPQLLQGMMVSSVKVEGGSVTGTTTSLPQSLAGGRVVQLIRHGGKVTAITTRQPLNKIKTSGQSGPPPNVTIQGRINMNDLMESHIASLLTGGTQAITQSPTVVSKIIQQQATGHPTVQQVVMQPSSAGSQVLQQVSVQQIPSTPTKAHQQQQKCGVIQQLTSGEELLGLTTPPRSLHVNLPALSATVLSSTTSVASAVTNTQTIVNSPVIMNTSGNTSGPSPLSVPPSSPLTPQTHPVTSPNQPVSASPHTLSPANEQPPTPSSFQMGEESNSSEQSVGDGAGPLPPFFTLKSFIMQQPQQKQRSQSQQSQQEQQSGHDKSYSTASEQNFTSTVTQAVSSVINSPVNKPQRGNQTHVHLHHNQHPRKPASVIRTGGSSGRILVGGTGEGNGKSVSHNVTSPLLSSGTGDTNVPLSPMSGSSSLESSPATTQSRIRLASRPQDMRSSSIDSLKSDLSVEEVQIPPSPATLTKQLQNAYMTEAALSPSVSQSQHSGSSYSSPGTTHDLPFTEAAPTSEDSFPATLSQPGCSSAPSAPGLSVTGVTLESDSGLAALTSPSGDIYLHQSGSSLGLDGLEAATLPLVAGMEVRTHSPALSDLVSSGPLLTWSPRSADSMMAQSPSLNDALTANIPLDGNHSEDSLCDSSTGFPGLFSIEGDGVSVSSSTSEDMPSGPLGTVASNQQQDRQESIEITIDLTPEESEQDHTITSTRSPTQLELPVTNLRAMSGQRTGNAVRVLGSPTSQDTPWRFENTLDSQNTRQSPNIPRAQDEKSVVKQEDGAGPSDTVQDKFKSSSSSLPPDKKEKLKKQYDGDKVASDIPNQTMNMGKRSEISKKAERNVEVRRNSTVSEGNKKRSHRLASLLEGRKGTHQNESGIMEDEVSTKNGHEETNVTKVKTEESNMSVAKIKRRSSQRTTVVYPGNVQSTPCRNRSKIAKSEDVKKEDSDLMESFVKEEKPIKKEEDCKESCEDVVLRLQEGCEETLGRTTRGSKRRTEGDIVADLKRGRGTRAGRRGEGEMKTEDELVNHLEEDCTLSRTLRGRHVSGASDTSSNYSMERALTPGPHEFLSGISSSSNSNRRRRRLSRESSASSRDGSPTLLHTHDFSPGGVNTRRSSSRDHAKKKKCSCCVGGDQKKKSGPGSSNSTNRRSSSRATRASHSGTMQ